MTRPLLLLLVLTSGVKAGLAPAYAPMDPEFAASDAVVVARCLSVERNDPSQPTERDGHLVPLDYVFRYSAVKAYKGANLPAAFRVLYHVADPAEGAPGCSPGLVLLFLTSGGSGEPFAWADPNFALRSFPGQPPSGATGQSGLQGLENDLVSFLPSGGAQSKMALSLLADFVRLSGAGADALAAFAGHLDRDASLLRLEILVRAGRREYFEELAREAQDPPVLDPQTWTLFRVCHVLEAGRVIKDLTALEELVRRAPTDSSLRECAMRGIRSLKTGAGVPFLIREIDDANLLVSHQAVLALNEIVNMNGEYGPGMQLFEKEPERCRALWRRWWEQTGSFQYTDSAAPHN